MPNKFTLTTAGKGYLTNTAAFTINRVIVGRRSTINNDTQVVSSRTSLVNELTTTAPVTTALNNSVTVRNISPNQFSFELRFGVNIGTFEFNEVGLYVGNTLFAYLGLESNFNKRLEDEANNEEGNEYFIQLRTDIIDNTPRTVTTTFTTLDYAKISAVNSSSLPTSTSLLGNNNNAYIIKDFTPDRYIAFRDSDTSRTDDKWNVASWHTQRFSSVVTATSVTSNTITLSSLPSRLTNVPEYFPSNSYNVIVRVHSGTNRGKLYDGSLNVSNRVITLGTGEGIAIGNGSQVQILSKSPTEIDMDYSSYQWATSPNGVFYIDGADRIWIGKPNNNFVNAVEGIQIIPHLVGKPGITNNKYGPGIKLIGNEFADSNTNPRQTLRNKVLIDVGAKSFDDSNSIIEQNEVVYIEHASKPALTIKQDSGSSVIRQASVIIEKDGRVSGGTINDDNRFRNTFIRFKNQSQEAGEISYSSNNSVNYSTTSDRRRKKDIEPLANAIDTIKKIYPVKFNWKDEENKEKSTGFIAQELQSIIPEAVSGSPDSKEMMAVDYGKLTPILTAALKEALTKIETLETEIMNLNTRLNNIERK